LTLEVIGTYNMNRLDLNKAQILQLISNNFPDTYEDFEQADLDSPLLKLLYYFFQKEEGYFKEEAILKVADGIILNYTYEKPDGQLKDFDAMDFDSLVQYFEQEQWPCFKFKIELSDELFGLQLDQMMKEMTISYSLGFGGRNIEVCDQPILWKDYKDMV